MNIVLLKSGSIHNNRSIIKGRQHLHLSRVLKVGVGSTFRVGQINGLIGDAMVTSIDDDSTAIELSLTDNPPPPLPLGLILALPRPKMLKRVLQSMASMGLKSVYIINAYKVEKSYWQSKFLEPEKIMEQLILGLEQSCDTWMPEISLHQSFKQFIEYKIGDIVCPEFNFVAHPNGSVSCPIDLSAESLIAVGPEGGFTPYEIQKFEENGFRSVTLGPRILRVENAVTAILARLYPN